MKKIIILLFLIVGSVVSASDDKPVEYLGMFEKEKKSFTVKRDNQTVVFQRTMTSCAKNKGWFQDFVPAEGITLVNEKDMLNALNDKDSLIVDMRIISHFERGTIPFSINIPYTDVALRMDELGCEETDNGLDCKNAKKVYGFCNGPVCAQSPIAMRTMLSLGFPANKLFYYRGGMLVWDALGLPTVKGEF